MSEHTSRSLLPFMGSHSQAIVNEIRNLFDILGVTRQASGRSLSESSYTFSGNRQVRMDRQEYLASFF